MWWIHIDISNKYTCAEFILTYYIDANVTSITFASIWYDMQTWRASHSHLFDMTCKYADEYCIQTYYIGANITICMCNITLLQKRPIISPLSLQISHRHIKYMQTWRASYSNLFDKSICIHQYTYIRICVQTTHVNTHAGRRDYI